MRANLNKAKGNMYEFITHTFNPVSGNCPFQCEYCYMIAMKSKGGAYAKALDRDMMIYDDFQKLGTGKHIFIGSSTDMFSDIVPDSWIKRVIAHCMAYPENRYWFQSKNPARFHEFVFPVNSTLCTTIESNRKYTGTTAPDMQSRAEAMADLPYAKAITIEPVMDFDIPEFVEILKTTGADWISIGANTSGNVKIQEPEKAKVIDLISELKTFAGTVFQKENLKRILK